MPHIKTSQLEKARYIYFTTAKTKKDIARIVEVSPKTISTWVREGNWAAQKKDALYSPDQQTHHLYEQLREINNNIAAREPGQRFGTKEELEAQAKIISIIFGPLKGGTDNWRNTAPDVDFEDEQEAGGPEGFRILIDGIEPRRKTPKMLEAEQLAKEKERKKSGFEPMGK